MNEQKWKSDRAGKWTASEIWKLFVEPKTNKDKEAGKWSDTAETYILEKAVERMTGERSVYQNKAMVHGVMNEMDALDYWKQVTGQNWTFTNKQFFAIDEISGASPDAVLFDGIDAVAVVDVKCPQFMTFFAQRKAMIDNEPMEKMYYYQLQMQMMACKAPKAFLVYYLAKEFANTYTGEVEHKFDLPLGLRIFYRQIDADQAVQDEMRKKIHKAEAYCQQVIKLLKGE